MDREEIKIRLIEHQRLKKALVGLEKQLSEHIKELNELKRWRDERIEYFTKWSSYIRYLTMQETPKPIQKKDELEEFDMYFYDSDVKKNKTSWKDYARSNKWKIILGIIAIIWLIWIFYSYAKVV